MYLSNKLSSHVAKNDSIIGFSIIVRNTNSTLFKQLVLVAIEFPGSRIDVKQHQKRITIYQPVSSHNLYKTNCIIICLFVIC